MNATTLEGSWNNPWIKRAIVLSWMTIAYNLLEGFVSMWLGAAEESFALFGFGADSFIEVASAVLVLWRFRSDVGMATRSLEREKIATAGIGSLFLVLAVFTLAGATFQLASRAHPETTIPGLVISAVSLSFMFFLWRAKVNVANQLDSATMRGDASCSLACIKLSVILFFGSLLFLLTPALWWADAMAAWGLGLLIAREGWSMISAVRQGRITSCCAGTCHEPTASNAERPLIKTSAFTKELR